MTSLCDMPIKNLQDDKAGKAQKPCAHCLCLLQKRSDSFTGQLNIEWTRSASFLYLDLVHHRFTRDINHTTENQRKDDQTQPKEKDY